MMGEADGADVDADDVNFSTVYNDMLVAKGYKAVLCSLILYFLLHPSPSTG